MNKDEFLRQLEVLLSGISQEERTEALAFYRSYFEDAGEANEAKILEELESPQKVADSIIKDLGVQAGEAGASGAQGAAQGSPAGAVTAAARPGPPGARRPGSGLAPAPAGTPGRTSDGRGLESGSAGKSGRSGLEPGSAGGGTECSIFCAGEGWNARLGDRSSGHHFAGVAGDDSGHTVSIARDCGGAVWNCNSGCGSHGSTPNLRCGDLWCRNRKCICRKSCNRNRAYGSRTHRAGDRYSCGGTRGMDFWRISAMGIERNLEALQKAV